MVDLPLNRAQRALWFAQQMAGEDVPIAVAQCLEMSGALDADALAACIDEVCAELGVSTARLVVDGPPALRIDGDRTPQVAERVSLAAAPDPEAAAEAWMRAASHEPLPLSGPLLRCALLTLGPSRWTFYARAHHLLLDGYAAALMMRHVAHRYRVRSGSTELDGPPAARQIDVILDHERAYEDSARRRRDQDYWRNVTSRIGEPLRLGDRGDQGLSARTHLVGVDLDSSPRSSLRAAADRTGVPTVAVLVAAGAMCLSRLCDRQSVPLTLVTSGRTSAAVRAAAGTMSNLLPILVAEQPDASVDEHLRTVSSTLSDALRHQRFRYEDMVGDRRLRRLGPVVNLVPSTPDVSLGEGVRCDVRILTTGPVDDVNLNVYPGGDGVLRVEVEVNAAVHSAATAQVLLDGMTACVNQLCAAPGDARVDRLIAYPDVRPLTGDDNGRRATLVDGYLRHRHSHRTAVIGADGRTYTYRELAARAAGVAGILRDRATPGDVVAVACRRSTDSVVAAWAVAAAGMCVLPVDPALPAARRRTMLDDSRPALVLGRGDGVDVDLAAVHPTQAELNATSLADPATVETLQSNAAYLLYTSGSTGLPKGIMVSHNGIGELLGEMDDHYGLDETSVVAHLASPGFDTAIVEMLAAANAGATLAIVPPDVRGGPELAQFLDARRVTHLCVTPAVLATLASDELPTLTHLVVGGDVCPAPLIRRWTRGRTVRCAYGPTETTCSVTLTDPVDPDGVEPLIPLGHPMSGVRLHVLDRRLRPVPPGGEGELYVAGPSLAIGVLAQAGRTSDRFVASIDGDGGRMYRTGDRVQRGVDDRLWFRGRSDVQVKIRGVRVEPAETDRAILQTGMVTASATVPHVTAQGTALYTYVVAGAGADVEGLSRRLRDRVRETVGAPHTPAGVTLLDALPLTVNNKLDSGRLPPPITGERSRFRAPTDDVEAMVVRAFERALGTSDIGLDDDFFDLAGDSLTATAVVAEVNAASGARIGVRDVFASGTAARLARLVESSRAVPDDTTAEVNEWTPLAPAQRNVFDRRADVDHVIAFEARVPAALSASDVRDAVASLMTVHPMLRSRFADDATFTIDDRSDPASWGVESVESAVELRRLLHAPIDVTDRYPLRAVVATSDDATVVGLAFHHLAVDGVSLRLMADGLLGAVSEAGGDYRDYARRARARAAQMHDRDVAHFAPAASMTTDLARPGRRPASWDRSGARVRRPVDATEWTHLASASRDRRVTELTALRAALASIVARRTGQSDVVIGALTSGRDDSRWARVVGMFVNTVAVVCPVSDSWEQTLKAVRSAEDAAFAHDATAFSDVVAAVSPLTLDRHPLFQVMLTMDDDFATGSGALITPLPMDIAHCDLHFSVIAPTEGRDGWVEVLYATALFDADEVMGLADDLVEWFSDR